MRGTGKFVVGGNWKCNGDGDSIKSLVAELNAGVIDTDVEIVCAPPLIYMDAVKDTINGGNFAVAAQDCWVGMRNRL